MWIFSAYNADTEEWWYLYLNGGTFLNANLSNLKSRDNLCTIFSSKYDAISDFNSMFKEDLSDKYSWLSDKYTVLKLTNINKPEEEFFIDDFKDRFLAEYLCDPYFIKLANENNIENNSEALKNIIRKSIKLSRNSNQSTKDIFKEIIDI